MKGKEKKKKKNIQRHITLHAVRCKTLKFPRLMFLKRSCFVTLWVGRELIIVMLARKKTHIYISIYINIYQIRFSSSRHISTRHRRRYLDFFRCSEECYKCETSKRENVIQCIGSFFFYQILSDMRFVEVTGWTSRNLSHFVFPLTVQKPRSNMNVPIYSYDFCRMLLVFNVNSGQECQLHVELISMSVTDFSYSQVGLARPQSWTRCFINTTSDPLSTLSCLFGVA